MASKDITLCIPGPWKDRSDIITAIAQTHAGEYVVGGYTLLHVSSGNSFRIEIEERNPKMREAFELGGQALSEADFRLIDQHQSVVYIIGEGGSMETADKVVHAGNAFLSAGGWGLKVETSGKAFMKEQWLEITAQKEVKKYFDAFTVLLRAEDGAIYSCGFHNIGYRDIICESYISEDVAVDLVVAFAYYLLYDRPVVEPGQTFSMSAKAPAFRIITENCALYSEDDLFYNPFGLYRLTPANSI